MRSDLVGHASLLVRQGELRILSDPWWAGPAYRGQWYPYPLPRPDAADLRELDAVYISHAHEDHLHRGTLKVLLEVNPDVLAVIPKRYDAQMRDYLERIGFTHIRELASGVPFTLRKGSDSARLTMFTHMDDSLIVIEAVGQVLVNANDALHSARIELIEEYCRLLRRRFPRIDYLFCGFGGASYFPNCIRVPGKDDRAVARARELFFLRNFAIIARRLQPRFAFPFAAAFVLPHDRTWWISAERLSMEPPSRTVRRLLPDGSPTQVHDLSPGDGVEDGVLHVAPRPAARDLDAIREAVLARYPTATKSSSIGADEFNALVEEVRARVVERAAEAGTRPLEVILEVWDYPAQVIHITVVGGNVRVEPIPTEAAQAIEAEVVFGTRSDLIASTMRSPFGRDLITVGYAAEVRFRSRAAITADAHERLLGLLAAPQPRWRERLRRDPLRTLGFVLGDASMRYELKSRLGLARTPPRQAHEPAVYGIGDWVDLAIAPQG